MGTLASELFPIATGLTGHPRVYADANLPRGAIHAMRLTLAWDVLFVLEDEALRRATDTEHFRRARDLGRTIITLDHDFFNAARFPPEAGAGVVVCSAPGEAALRRLLADLDRAHFRAAGATALPFLGRIVEMTPDGLCRAPHARRPARS
jgi:hypothetical protein